MPYATLPRTPLAPHLGPVRIFYRDHGRGAPILFLHGGWGYGAYPLDRAVSALRDRWRIVIPDRTGYGRSPPLQALAPGFHAAAAEETLALLDALGIRSAVLWGHSDGAVIAARAALAAPGRVRALVLEALHFFRHKRSSIGFFEDLTAPDRLPPDVRSALAADHGEPYWRTLSRAGGEAWLRIIAEGATAGGDLYDGALPALAPPVLLVHGAQDPRTEPGELDAIRGALPAARLHLVPDVGHSPHSSRRAGAQVADAVGAFLAELGAESGG